MVLKSPMIPRRCAVCGDPLPKRPPGSRRGGRPRLYCSEPKPCRAKAGKLGIAKPQGRLVVRVRASRRKETLAELRYREALAALQHAKEIAEVARIAVANADGAVEQAEYRVRDAQIVVQREAMESGDEPAVRAYRRRTRWASA